MTRLDYTQASVGTVSEHVMQKATRACLLACAGLLSAVCHCDLRFPNVLWDPQPFLADLGFAHSSPWKVNMITLMVCRCKQLKSSVHLTPLWLPSRSSMISLSGTGMRVPLMTWVATNGSLHVIGMGCYVLKSRHLSAVNMGISARKMCNLVHVVIQDMYWTAMLFLILHCQAVTCLQSRQVVTAVTCRARLSTQASPISMSSTTSPASS